MKEENLKEIESIIGKVNVICKKGEMLGYIKDEFPSYGEEYFPDVVVKPKDKREIKEIVKIANREKILITPRGSGTGLCGGCVPIKGGILISFENVKKIIEIGKDNFFKQ